MFGMCCYQGKITLPPLQPVPDVLNHYLVDQDPISSCAGVKTGGGGGGGGGACDAGGVCILYYICQMDI